ncbi:seryl-tRNA synthetase [Rhizophlyctis rosea]|nr:seryl-tRNA synthetase [Rhizophlyctis rosea]
MASFAARTTCRRCCAWSALLRFKHKAQSGTQKIFVRQATGAAITTSQTSSPVVPRTVPSQTPSATTPRLFSPHLNYRQIRANASQIKQNALDRNVIDINVDQVISLYDSFVAADFQLAELRRQRNRVAGDIAGVVKELKGVQKGGEEWKALNSRREELAREGKDLKPTITALEGELSKLESQLYEEARHIPNDTHPSTPIGDETKARLLDTISTPLPPTFPSGTPRKTHPDLCTLHDMADFDRAGKVTGNSFYYLRNAGALLEMALTRYAMDICLKHGFTPVLPPDLVRHEVLEACGFSPRSSDPQTFYIQAHNTTTTSPTTPRDPLQLCLSATAEFPLAAYYANETLSPQKLPVKMVGMGRAFRAEGAAGAINRGLYRVHQFTKVEMFVVSDGEGSEAVLEEIVTVQREIFEGLELCFRVLDMPSGDLGAPAYRKVDMEAWMPGRGAWGEISSASNCTDYQSRRLNIRHFTSPSSPSSPSSADVSTTSNSASSVSPLAFAHTINGTAAAIPRLIIALLETHQRENGDVYVPVKLRKYLYGEGVDVLRVGEGGGKGGGAAA